MAQEKITIKFEPQGHTKLIQALNNLHKAQKGVTVGANGTTNAVKKFSGVAAGLTAKLKLQNITWKQLGVSSDILKKAYQGNRLALEKLKLAMQDTTKAGLFQTNSNRLLSNSFATLRSQLLLVAFASTLFAQTLGRLMKAAVDQQDAELKLAASLGRTSKELLNHASAMQQVTKFGDETVISAQSMIAAFIKDEESVKALTEATIDLAAAKGMDLTAAADLVAKSVGSSTNALSRYGIAATGAAKSTERAESIVKNISVLYGGQAKAQAEGYAGTIEGMKNAIGDAAESIGELIAPAIITFSTLLKNLSNMIELATDGLHTIAVATDNFFFGLTSIKKATVDYSSDLAVFQEGLSDLSFGEITDELEQMENMFKKNNKTSNEGSVFLNKNRKDINALIAPVQALAASTGQLNNGNSEMVATSEALANAMAHELDIADRLKIIEGERIKRQATAQELYSKTGEAQASNTRAMIEWVKQNENAFESTSAYLSVLKMLENQLNKTGEGWTAQASIAGSSMGKISKSLVTMSKDNFNQTQMALQLGKAEGIANIVVGASTAIKAKGLLGVLEGVAIMSSGMALIANIDRQIAAAKSAGKFEQGGLIGGRRHSQGGTMIEAEQGEFVINRNAVESIGLENLNRMNQTGGGGAINVSISGNVMSQDFVEGELAEQIKEAVRRGTDFGVG
tara:strand:+ start:2342 stop:4393 length:2052 start_codon:yes stop_codon:yes gene_type:complete